MTTWRQYLAPLVEAVILEVGTDDMPKLRKALREAFPAPPRKRYPYRVWLDEINVQLGVKARRDAKKTREALVAAGQMEMEDL